MDHLPSFPSHFLSLPLHYEHLYRTTISPHQHSFPQTTSDFLMKSAKLAQSLLKDATKVVDLFAQSKPFSNRIMKAAQESNQYLVTEMIRKTGVKTVPDIHFDPEGIRLDFYPKTGEDVCHVIISLKWQEW